MAFADSVLEHIKPSFHAASSDRRRASAAEHEALTAEFQVDGFHVLTLSEDDDDFDTSGAKRIEAVQSIWGRHGKKYIIFG